MQSLLVEGVQPTSMFVLMCGMGITLTSEDFRRIRHAPGPTLTGTFLQLLAMPLVGIGLAVLFALPLILAAGLVVMAACPGGMFSNVFIHVARANAALSITLTATATLASLFCLPFWVQGVAAMRGDTAGAIEMPVLETAANLAGLTVVPVLLGMWIRMRWPEVIRQERRLTLTGVGGIALSIAIDTASQSELPLTEIQQSLGPVVLLLVAAGVLGLGVPLLLRHEARDAVTISVELIVKNVLLGLVLARQSLDFEATIPILIFGAAQAPIGIVLLVGWRLWARRRGMPERGRAKASQARGG